LSNIFSPFLGPWELLWMPFVNVLGAGTAWLIGHRIKGVKGMALGGLLYALWVSIGVGTMLYSLFGVPLALGFLYLLVPETILIVGFSPVMAKVNERIASRFG
jgi:hypothetical protein